MENKLYDILELAKGLLEFEQESDDPMDKKIVLNYIVTESGLPKKDSNAAYRELLKEGLIKFSQVTKKVSVDKDELARKLKESDEDEK